MSSSPTRECCRPAVLGLALLAAAMPHAAAEQSGWSYEFTPYIYFSALEGTAGARGVEAEVDESFNDIWNNLDIGLMGLFIAQNGPWTLMFDGVHLSVDDQASKSVTGPGGLVTVRGALELSSSLTVLQPSVLYRVYDNRTMLDVGAGVRYTRVGLDLDVKVATDPGIVFPGGEASFSGSDSWLDAVAVGRVIQPLSDRWSLVGYADLGGGESTLTYQFVAGANWTANERLTAKAGYRYAYWDHEDGGRVWDMSASGPFLGLGISF